MNDIISMIKEKGFTKSIEIVPSRNGMELEVVFDKLNEIKKLGLDFVSVTKGAGGSLRGGTLPLTYFLKHKFGIESLAHFTCREVTKEQIENELVDHNYFGINNILALRGDPPVGSTEKKWKGEYNYAWQLVERIKMLNKGQYIPRKGFENNKSFRGGAKTNFCIGVAAHPESTNLKQEAKFLKLKQDKGAQFAITQMIFNAKLYKKYIKAVREAGVTMPIIPGIRPITKYELCLKTEEWFGVKVPGDFKNRMKGLEGKDAEKEAVDFSLELCKNLTNEGAPGLHFFVLSDIKLFKNILGKL